MNYTREHMETACCLWEGMLEAREKIPDLGRAFMKRGTAVMREVAIDLAVEIDEEWNELTQDARDDIGSFDWEFCPMVISLIDWSQWPIVR